MRPKFNMVSPIDKSMEKLNKDLKDQNVYFRTLAENKFWQDHNPWSNDHKNTGSGNMIEQVVNGMAQIEAVKALQNSMKGNADEGKNANVLAAMSMMDPEMLKKLTSSDTQKMATLLSASNSKMDPAMLMLMLSSQKKGAKETDSLTDFVNNYVAIQQLVQKRDDDFNLSKLPDLIKSLQGGTDNGATKTVQDMYTKMIEMQNQYTLQQQQLQNEKHNETVRLTTQMLNDKISRLEQQPDIEAQYQHYDRLRGIFGAKDLSLEDKKFELEKLKFQTNREDKLATTNMIVGAIQDSLKTIASIASSEVGEKLVNAAIDKVKSPPGHDTYAPDTPDEEVYTPPQQTDDEQYGITEPPAIQDMTVPNEKRDFDQEDQLVG